MLYVTAYELNVFQGAVNLIANSRPIIVFEFWETWFIKVRPIFEFLKPGYTFFSTRRGEDAYNLYFNNEYDDVTDILCLPINSNRLNYDALQNPS